MEQQRRKLNYRKTTLTGFGFVAVAITWAIYPAYMTKLLDRLLSASAVVAQWSQRLAGAKFLADYMASQGESAVSAAGKFTVVPLLIGIIMTFLSVFGLFFQPVFGRWSDRFRSRLGKRRPFILVAAPVSAFFFALFPFMHSLPSLIICILLFSFFMAVWRAPVTALMPDLTPPALRSEGNAVINLMSGVGAIVGLAAGKAVSLLYCKAHGITAAQLNEFVTYPYVFIVGASVVVISTLVLLFFVKEEDSRLLRADAVQQTRAEKKQARLAERLGKGERVSFLLMLAGAFFLYCGINAMQTFFALFAGEILHKTSNDATILMALFGICMAAGALPSGKMGTKLGRKKTILAGLSLFMVGFVVFFGGFLSVLGKNKLTMQQFTALNSAYTQLEKRVADWNEHHPDDANFTASNYIQALTVDGDSAYPSFHRHLEETGFDFEQYISLADQISGEAHVDRSPYGLGAALKTVQTAVTESTRAVNLLIYPVMVIAGFASMMITVNGLPLVLELGGPKRIGAFTSYYYTAIFGAQIAAPITYGVFRMFSGSYMSLFYYCPIVFVAAAAFILFVRHGEAETGAAPAAKSLSIKH